MKKIGLFIFLVLAAACDQGTTPPAPPTTDPNQAVLEQAIRGECAALWRDELARDINATEQADCLKQRLSGVSVEDWRAHLRTTDEWIALHPALTPLRRDGALLVNGRGERFIWKGLTAFRLVEKVHAGQDIEAYLSWAVSQDVTIVRVLSMASNLFKLAPEDGRRSLQAMLEAAKRRGLYVEVVALADTRSYASMDMAAHVIMVGSICQVVGNCVIEIGNELEPVHETQLDQLSDLAYLRKLRASIPSSIPVSLGSTHGSSDESDKFKDGDFLTIHGDRADGDGGWRWVRHTNEQRALADRLRLFAVNDEPRRNDLDAGRQMAIAILCRMFNIGDTFHYGGGLQADIATGPEADALAARRRGWAAIPADWRGSYMNAGFVGSPVKSFSGAVRVYSSVNGGQGYSLAFGVNGDQIDWNWAGRELQINESGVKLWRVAQ